MTRQLAEALRELRATATAGAVVLAGAPPGFCAGSDLKELAGLDVAEMGRHEAEIAALCRSFLEFPKPLIAAVEGFAIGGGFVRRFAPRSTGSDEGCEAGNTRHGERPAFFRNSRT